jgi:hypothetical protein
MMVMMKKVRRPEMGKQFLGPDGRRKQLVVQTKDDLGWMR